MQLWDLQEGRVQAWEHRASEQRIEAMEEAKGYRPAAERSHRDTLELRVRLATIYTDEGRYWRRCDPESGRSETLFESALTLADQIPSPELPPAIQTHLLRRRADALCGLGRWEACLSAMDRLLGASTDPALVCEALAWRGDSLMDQGDPIGAQDAYERAASLGSAPACRYAQTKVPFALYQAGAAGEASQALIQLIDAELALLHGPPVSLVLEAAVLELPHLVEGPEDMRPSSALTRLSPVLLKSLMGHASGRTRAQTTPETLAGIVSTLMDMELLEPAWGLISTFDAEFGHGSSWSRAQVRRARAQSSIEKVLETLLIRFVEEAHRIKVRDQGLPARASAAARFECRATTMYLARFPGGAGSPQIQRGLSSDSVCEAPT